MSVLPHVSVFVLDVSRSSLGLRDEAMLSSSEQQQRVAELLDCVRCGVLEYAHLTRPFPEVQTDNPQPLSVIVVVNDITHSLASHGCEVGVCPHLLCSAAACGAGRTRRVELVWWCAVRCS